MLDKVWCASVAIEKLCHEFQLFQPFQLANRKLVHPQICDCFGGKCSLMPLTRSFLLHHKVRHMMHDFPTMRAVGKQTHLTHKTVLFAWRRFSHVKMKQQHFIIEGLNGLKAAFVPIYKSIHYEKSTIKHHNILRIWHLYFSSSGQNLSQPQGD